MGVGGGGAGSGVSSQLSVVGLVSVLGLISVCDIDQAGGGAGRLFVVVV